MKKTLLRNMSSNWIGFLVHAVVAFFLTPFIIDRLGGTRYGIWLLITSMTGYYGLLTLGLNAGTTQQITKCFSECNYRKLNQVASAASFVLFLFGLLVLGVALVVAVLAPLVFSVDAEFSGEMRIAIVVTGIATAIQFSLFGYAAIFTATQRYDLTNAIGILMRLLSAVATIVVLNLGGELVSLCVVIATFDSAGAILRTIIAKRLIPQLKLRWTMTAREPFRDIASFSGWNLINMCGERLLESAGVFVIALLMEEAAIAPYGAALSLTFYLARVLGSGAVVFYPAAAKLYADRRIDALERMFLTGVRGMLMLAAICSATAFAFAEDFYLLWLGDRLLDWQDYPPVAALFQAMLVGLIAHASVLIGHQVLLGAHRLREICILVSVEAGISLVVTGVGVAIMGVWGAVLGTMIGAVIVRFVLFPLAVGTVTGTSFGRYCKEGLLRPAAFLMIAIPFALLARHISGPQGSWATFFLAAGGCVTVLTLLAVPISLTQAEIRAYIIRPATATACGVRRRLR